MFTPEMAERLQEPFGIGYIDNRPGASYEGEALVLTFIDSRAVQSRLDDAVGPQNWSFDWETVHHDGEKMAVKGTITVFGVSKSDAGQADQEEEPYKSAVSDAMKRTAVLWGVGRYLYDMPKLYWPVNGKKFKDADTLREIMHEISVAIFSGDDGAIAAARARFYKAKKGEARPPQQQSAPQQARQGGNGGGRIPAAIVKQIRDLRELKGLGVDAYDALKKELGMDNLQTDDLSPQQAMVLMASIKKLPDAAAAAA